MRTVTFGMLRDLDPGPLAALVEATAALAGRCVELQHRVEVEASGRLVRAGWSGPASQAALSALDRPDDAFELAALRHRAIAAALDTVHMRLSRLQDEARSIAEQARAAGLGVTGHGAVLDPFDDAADPEAANRTAAVATRLRHRIDHLLTAADQADADAVAMLHDLLRQEEVDVWSRSRDATRIVAEPFGVTLSAIPRDGHPAEAHEWWQLLTPQQRELYLTAFPERIGALDGLPAADRDRANRLALRIAHATAGEEHDRRGAARTQMLLGRLEAAQLDPAGAPLLLLDLDNRRGTDGQAVVAVADPDRARHQAVVVPGVTATLDGFTGELDRAGRIRDTADALTPDIPADVSVVAWLGYDAPGQDVTAVTGQRAEAGAPALSAFVASLRETHPGHVTVIGHSYGSTVVGVAAAHAGLRADDVVAVGSPGMRVDRIEHLQTAPGHVWAGAADGDDVTGWMSLFAHGPEPHRDSFGANRFHVDTRGHGAYWDEGSLSLANQAAIVVARYDRVALDHGSPPSTVD
jgi:alpha/beta hydrolase family protein